MIKDIKMSFKILKYGINVKVSVIFAVIFFVLSFFLDMVGSTLISSMYIPIVSMYFGQIAHSFVQSTMVQSSPYKKSLQTKIPVLAMGVVLLVYNTLIVLWRYVLLSVNPERELEFIMGSILGGITIVGIMLYFAFAMKFFYPATVCFFLAFYSLSFGTGYRVLAGADTTHFWGIESMPMAILFSYLCIFIGCGINYGASVLLYKKDYSQQNFKKALDRAK